MVDAAMIARARPSSNPKPSRVRRPVRDGFGGICGQERPGEEARRRFIRALVPEIARACHKGVYRQRSPPSCRPAPRDILPRQSTFQIDLVFAFPPKLGIQQQRATAAMIVADHDGWRERHIDALKMSTQRPSQIERSLQPRFLTGSSWTSRNMFFMAGLLVGRSL